MTSESLANAYEQEGDLQKAIEVLEAAAQSRMGDFSLRGAPHWMRTQLRLAELYRKVGRDQEAITIENKLRKLLAYADSDHPILRKLQSPQTVAFAQQPN